MSAPPPVAYVGVAYGTRAPALAPMREIGATLPAFPRALRRLSSRG